MRLNTRIEYLMWSAAYWNGEFGWANSLYHILYWLPFRTPTT